MIKKFVEQYEANKARLEKLWSTKHPESYAEIVKEVVKTIGEPLDVNRITEIDHGNYQGTLVYVIAVEGYQPSDYFSVAINYGSCSVCDTLEGIRDYESGVPKAEQITQYMTLCLHVVQGLKYMDTGYGIWEEL